MKDEVAAAGKFVTHALAGPFVYHTNLIRERDPYQK